MEIAVHLAADFGQVRYHLRNIRQFQLVDAHGKVLQSVCVVGAVYTHTCAVVRHKLHVRLHAFVFSKENVIAVVDMESLVSQHGVSVADIQPYAVVFHTCLEPQSYTEPVFFVVNFPVDKGASFMKPAVEQGVEHIHVLVIVAYLGCIVDLRRIRQEVQPYGINPDTVHHQRIY